jgi:hypothetical protein
MKIEKRRGASEAEELGAMPNMIAEWDGRHDPGQPIANLGKPGKC